MDIFTFTTSALYWAIFHKNLSDLVVQICSSYFSWLCQMYYMLDFMNNMGKNVFATPLAHMSLLVFSATVGSLICTLAEAYIIGYMRSSFVETHLPVYIANKVLGQFPHMYISEEVVNNLYILETELKSSCHIRFLLIKEKS